MYDMLLDRNCLSVIISLAGVYENYFLQSFKKLYSFFATSVILAIILVTSGVELSKDNKTKEKQENIFAN